MSVIIEITNISNPDIERPVRAAIEDVFKAEPNNYCISLRASQDNDVWILSLEGLKSVQCTHALSGAEEHRPEYISRLLKQVIAVPSGRS